MNSPSQNQTRETRPCGIVGGGTETWSTGVGLRPMGKLVDKPPNPKAERAVFLPDFRPTWEG